jgi:ureidoacrylate peracid hydrolase
MAKLARLNPSLSGRHAGLVLFDPLNGYLHPNDAAKTAFLAQRNIIGNLQRLLRGAREAGITVFYPAGAHAPDGADSVDRLTDTDMDLSADAVKDRPIRPHFHRGSRDAEIAPELTPAEGDVVVPKQRWSAFFQTNLDLQLRVREIGTIVIAGGSTDVGIASTVFAARDLDYGIVVVRDACYSTRGPNHDFLMDRVFPRMARVMTTEQAVSLMTR